MTRSYKGALKMLIGQDPNRWKRFMVSFVLFLIIAGMVMSNSMILQVLDSVFQALFGPNPNHTPNMTYHLMVVVAFLGSPKMDIVWMLIITFFLWGFKYKVPALWAWMTLIVGDLLSLIIKYVVKRDRPLQHLSHDKGYSFPSGHVVSFFLIAAVLFLIVVPLIKKSAVRVICQLLLILAVFLVAVSRIYLYAHYPFDTVGAMLLTYAWLQISETLYLTFAGDVKNRWKMTSNSKL